MVMQSVKRAFGRSLLHRRMKVGVGQCALSGVRWLEGLCIKATDTTWLVLVMGQSARAADACVALRVTFAAVTQLP